MNNQAPSPWPRCIIYLAGGLLLTVALTRLLAFTTNAQILSQPDALIGVSLRWTTLTFALFQLSVALICLFGKNLLLQSGLLAWLLKDWILFRAGAYFCHCGLQCTCMGYFTDPLWLSNAVPTHIDQVTTLCLLPGAILFFTGYTKRSNQAV